MSILIKGIKLPKDGHWGTVSIPFYIHGDGSVSDSKGHIIGSAAPVPPHGRLIDADALGTPGTIEEDTLWRGRIETEVYLASTIYNAPTVIPAEPAEESTDI